MKLRLALVNQIDDRAWFPLATLIHSYVQNHPNVGMVEICQKEIRFTKGIFFTVGRIDYAPYQIICRNGVIYWDGTSFQTAQKDELFFSLASALRQLRRGYIIEL